MSGADNGGWAFPGFNYVSSNVHDGMTLRDYFAAHCDQPGQAEVVAEAGHIYSNWKVWTDSQTCVGTFDEWWKELPPEQRFSLYARVRYRMADAMLKARRQ